MIIKEEKIYKVELKEQEASDLLYIISEHTNVCGLSESECTLVDELIEKLENFIK